jgi:hypothetical protein
MPVGRVWDADNGVWQRIGAPPNVVSPTAPVSPADGVLWTNPDEYGETVYGSRLLGSAMTETATLGIGATTTNLGVDVVYTVPAGRLIRVTAQTMFFGYTGDTLRRLNIYHNGVQTGVGDEGYRQGSGWQTLKTAVLLLPTAGTHTASLRASSDAYTIDVYSRWLTVEDITQPPAPVLPPAPVSSMPIVQAIDTAGYAVTTTAVIGSPQLSITVPVTSYLLCHWGCQFATGGAAGNYAIMYPQIAGVFTPGNPDDEAYLVSSGVAYAHAGRSRLIGPVPPGTYVVQSGYRASANSLFTASRRWLIVEGRPV